MVKLFYDENSIKINILIAAQSQQKAHKNEWEFFFINEYIARVIELSPNDFKQ